MSTKVGSIHYDLNLNTSGFDSASEKVKGNLNQLGNRLDSFGSTLQGIGAQLTASVTAPLTAAGLVGIKTASELETARMGFITLLGSAEKADDTLKKIKEAAKKTPFEIVGLTQATQMLASITKDGDRALKFVLNVGEGLAAMGRGQAELDRIAVNLQQIAAVGRAATIDIKQFAFAGIPIYEMLQKETGLAGEALEEFVTQGGVTFDMLEKMFASATAEGGRFFGAYKNQTGTLAQLMSNLRDTFSVSMSDIVKDSGLFDLIKDKVKALTEQIEKLGNWFKTLSTEQKSLTVNVGLFAVALGPVLIILGTIVSSISKLIPLFGLLATPVGLIALKIGALVAVFVFLESKMKLITPAVMDTFNALSSFFVPIIQFLFRIIKEDLIPAFQNLFKALEPLSPLLSFLGFVIGGILGIAVGALGLVLIGLVAIISTVVNAIAGFINWVMATAKSLADFRQNIVGNVINFLNNLPNTFYNAGKGLFEAFKNGITSAASGVINKVKEVLGNIRKMLPFSDAKIGPLSTLTYSGTQLGETFAKGIMMSQGAIEKAMNTVLPNPTLAISGMGMPNMTPQQSGDINISIGTVQDRTDMDYLLNRIDMNQRMQLRGVAPL